MNDYVDILFKIQNQYMQKEAEIEDRISNDGTIIPAEQDKSLERKPNLRKEDKDNIVSLYEQGYSRAEIKELFSRYNSMSVAKVLDKVDRANKIVKNKEIAALVPKVKELKDKGYSDVDVSKSLGVSLDDLRAVYNKAKLLFPTNPFEGKESDECWRALGFTYDEADKVYELLNEGYSIASTASKLSMSNQKVSKCRKELQNRGLLGSASGKKKAKSKIEDYFDEGSIYADIYKQTKFTPRETEMLIRSFEAGVSNDAMSANLGKKISTIEKCRRLLNKYGIRLVRGKSTIYPDGFSIEVFQIDIPTLDDEVVINAVPNKKVSDLTREQKAKFIEMKQQGYSNLEVQEALSLSDDDVLLLLNECKKFKIKF